MEIKNKKGFTAQNFVVSLIIFSGCLSLLVLMVGSMANDYNNDNVIDPEFQNSFDKFDNTTKTAGDMYDALNSDDGLSLVGTADLFFTAGFSVISLVFSSITTASSILFLFPTYFGINTAASVVMMTMLFTILTTIICFSVINSLRGNKL